MTCPVCPFATWADGASRMRTGNPHAHTCCGHRSRTSGLLLSQLLNLAGISTVVLERKDRAYVLSRIRAGVLEWGTVEMLRAAGAAARTDREGQVHHGYHLASDGQTFRVDFMESCGSQVMVCGQTEVSRDLYDAQDAIGATTIHGAEDVALHDLQSRRRRVTWMQAGGAHELTCDFVAGCDGFHGISRPSIPAEVRREYEKVYPFGWLGILSRTPPVEEELIYASHARGFALCSICNPMLSRCYIQVPLTDTVEMWSDDAFWAELKARLLVNGLRTTANRMQFAQNMGEEFWFITFRNEHMAFTVVASPSGGYSRCILPAALLRHKRRAGQVTVDETYAKARATDLSPREIEIFASVMLLGTTTKAADSLDITQPAVSKTLQLLAEKAGFALFRKNRQRLVPTPEAHMLYAEVQRVYESVRSISRVAREIRELRSGRLNVCALPAFGLTLLPEVVTSFSRQQPSVVIALDIRSSSTVLQRASRNQLDIGIGVTASEELPSITRRALVDTSPVCVMPAGHRLAGKGILQPEDLHGMDFISMGSGDPMRMQLDALCEARGVKRIQKVEVGLSSACISLVAAGAGVAIVDRLSAWMARGLPIEIRDFQPHLSLHLSVYRPWGVIASTAADAFAEHLVHSTRIYMKQVDEGIRALSVR
jgi:DNA-binding transcriptional LysR family regulator